MSIDANNGCLINSLNELNARLGRYETIICLGNGPSSEDPRLANYRGVILFRVNWNWTQRNWFRAPQMVFTGDRDLVQLPREPIVAYPTQEIGESILLDHETKGHHGRAGFIYFDRFTPSIADFSKPKIPTNGALMVALAAALRPRRLVVAGIDLYRHPQGKYAGPTDNSVGYTSQHSVEIDLDLIGRTMAEFDGEIIILSDNLRNALLKL